MEIKYSQSRRKSAVIAGLLLMGSGLFLSQVEAMAVRPPEVPIRSQLEIIPLASIPPQALHDRFVAIGASSAPYVGMQALLESFINGKSFNVNQKVIIGPRIPLINFIATLPEDDLLQKSLANIDISVTIETAQGNTPLHFAAAHSTPCLTLLLKDGRLNINETNRNGETPLYIAMWYKNQANVNALLADPRIRVNATNELGRAALHMAVIFGDEHVVSQLVGLFGHSSFGDNEHIFNPNVRDDTGRTPADYLVNIRDLDLQHRIQNLLHNVQAEYGTEGDNFVSEYVAE
ncbi:MAG: ankyrin repeat domain-containing protein [Puniceicoccales bacterium]|jgi:hypothetical protein|nr:ankyrin repeat domain-containing protein [Puniceicoccales bacterium]